MVQLEFEIKVEAPFQSVWEYFGDFKNVADWDPSISKCEVIKKTENQVGSEYKVVSILNGKQSVINWTSREYRVQPDRAYHSMDGINNQIKAFDQMICQKDSQTTTTVKYRANIQLRGFYWLFTPFFSGGFAQMQMYGRQGCLKRCIQKWGKAN